MPTLYRHYRPQTFAQVMGQDHIVTTLGLAVTRQRLAHAYLFYGPRGTGKTTTARILAKRVNCREAAKDDPEPCTRCPVCLASQTNSNIDIIEIDAASHRGIDDIRALRETVKLRPAMGAYKVYIIDEVHMLTQEAFAALLKTLEEPSMHAIFILATTEFHKVPATIVSRCQIYRFRRATSEEMRQRLLFLLKEEKAKADEDSLNFIIQRSDGCYRDAESLLGQLLTAQGKKIGFSGLAEFLGLPPLTVIDQFLEALIDGQSAPALAVLEQSFSDGFDPEHLLKEVILRARDLSLALAKGERQSLPAFTLHQQTEQRLPLIMRALLQALQDLAFVPQPLLALELAVLTVCTTKGEARAPVIVPSQPMVTAKPVAKQSSAPRTTQTSPVIPLPQASQRGITLEKVKAVWPALIEATRQTYPVVSTFLRAVEPITIEGQRITMRAQYDLHRIFFEKPEQKVLLAQHLSQLLGSDVTVTCVTQESSKTESVKTETPKKESLPTPAPAAVQASTAAMDNLRSSWQKNTENKAPDNLYQAVQEVFGSTQAPDD